MAADNFNNNLFSDLEDFGFGSLSDIKIYSSPKERNEGKQSKSIQSAPEDFIYEKKIECPVCFSQITVKAVKSSGVRVLSRDSDFMTYYKDPNPMYYDVWMCTLCGYTAFSNKFGNITDKQRNLIKENISQKWRFKKIYPAIYDTDVAIEMHKLALLNMVVKMGRDSEKAMACLRLAWLYRIKNDLPNQNKYLYQAQQGFITAIEKESSPIVGLDEAGVEYLIGELYRRLGDNSNALLWFSRVLGGRNAKPKIKDMARNQKDVIRQQEAR